MRTTTASNAHSMKTTNTATRAGDAQRFSVAVVDLKQGVAAAWKTYSSVLDSDVAAAKVHRMTPAVESEDGSTQDLTKNVADGSNKKVH